MRFYCFSPTQITFQFWHWCWFSLAQKSFRAAGFMLRPLISNMNDRSYRMIFALSIYYYDSSSSWGSEVRHNWKIMALLTAQLLFPLINGWTCSVSTLHFWKFSSYCSALQKGRTSVWMDWSIHKAFLKQGEIRVKGTDWYFVSSPCFTLTSKIIDRRL